MSREDYYTALFALFAPLQANGTIKTLDRKLRLLGEVNASEMPALFLTVGTQNRRWISPQLATNSLTATLFLYVGNPNPRTAAGVALNELLDAVDAVLTPDMEPQTLGGLAEHVRIEGAIAIYEAPKGDRAAAAAPIVMLIP